MNVTPATATTMALTLNQQADFLLAEAKKAMKYAFSPYSNFRVGAALLAKDGTVYTGCNVENASYGATLCAERVAMVKAISEGKRSFQSIAIVSSGGDFTFPCGMCRQVLAEFGLDIIVFVEDQKEIKQFTMADFLPHAFTSSSLGIDTSK